MNNVFLGVDLHKNNNVAVLIDCFGQKITTLKVKNALSAFPKFEAEVQNRADGKNIILGLEDVNFYGRGLAR